MKLHLFKGLDGDWYWKNVARNGRIVATGGEGYRNKQDCQDQATLLFPDTEIVED